jgi:anti-sigma-K factor RskA
VTPSPDDDLQADLYIFGLLDAAQQSDAERRIERDEAFAARVAAAAQRFAPLDDAAPPVPLPEGAWARLEVRLSAPVERPAPLRSPAVAPKSAVNLNRAPWASILLALGLAWAVLAERRLDPAAVAVLLDPDGAPFALVEDFGQGEVAVTTLATFEVPNDQSLQVWTKWSEDVGPVSLGVLDRFEGARVGADDLPEPIAGQLFEITLEAEGGSATGRPTGPLLGVGRASIPG